MTKAQQLQVLERWYALVFANYLRYAHMHARAWVERSAFAERGLVRQLVEEQDHMLDRIAHEIVERDGVLPQPGWPEDVAYLNYVHLPVLFARAISRMDSTAKAIGAEAPGIDQRGEYDIADLGRDIVALLERQIETLKPHCASAEQVSPR